MRNLTRTLIVVLTLATLPIVSQAALFVGVSVGIAPPALPVYVQPPCPAPGYIWIPGYWAWDDGYYWVPGTWSLAPAAGLLWTPGYWGWAEGAYVWHEGYWGSHVGFYGGINYGFGYGGVGYQGGYWRGHEFYYNRAVTNIGTTNVTNVYNRTVVNNVTVNRVSFNGGAGGVVAHPTAAQIAAGHERHMGLTSAQRQQVQVARGNSSLRATVNGGRPQIAATRSAATHPQAPHAPATHAPPARVGYESPARGTPQGPPRAPQSATRASQAHSPGPAPQGRAPQYQVRAEPQSAGHERPGSGRPER